MSNQSSSNPCKRRKLEEEKREEPFGNRPPHDPLASNAANDQATDSNIGTLLPFHKFDYEVLYSDPLTKTIAVSGKFEDSAELGVIVAEKTPLTYPSLQRLFVSCKIEKKFQNDVYSQYMLDSKEGGAGEVRVMTVYPATEEHVKKYGAHKRKFVLETPELYWTVTKPFIERRSFSLDWVYNILDGKAEQRQVICDDPDPETGFVLLPDLKWDQKELDNLHVLAIARKRGILSLRELRSEHIPMLRKIQTRGKSELCNKYGIESDQLCVYLHYQPSFYHLHVHFTHIYFSAPKLGLGGGHLVDDIIDNIENIDPLFYAKKTLCFTVKETTALWEEFTKDCDSATP